MRALAASLLLLAMPAFAQQPDPERVAEARAILAAMQVEKQLDGMTSVMADSMTKQFTQGRPELNARVLQVMMEESMKSMKERVAAPGGLLDSMAQAYASQFTFGELRQIRTFYESQAGQRMLQAQPEIMKLVMPKLVESSRGMVPESCARARARLIAEKVENAESMKCPEAAK